MILLGYFGGLAFLLVWGLLTIAWDLLQLVAAVIVCIAAGLGLALRACYYLACRWWAR